MILCKRARGRRPELLPTTQAFFHNLGDFTKKSDPLHCCQGGSEKVSELDGKTLRRKPFVTAKCFLFPVSPSAGKQLWLASLLRFPFFFSQEMFGESDQGSI